MSAFLFVCRVDDGLIAEEPEREYCEQQFGDPYREPQTGDRECGAEFPEGAEEGKSNLFLFDHVDPIFKHNP